jgi:hypothetical protein
MTAYSRTSYIVHSTSMKSSTLYIVHCFKTTIYERRGTMYGIYEIRKEVKPCQVRF